MIQTTSVNELVSDVRGRLQEMAKSSLPPTPTKKVLEALDPAIRADVLAAAKALREEQTARKTVAGSVAKQTKALEKQMTDDLQTLLEVAGRAGGDARA